MKWSPLGYISVDLILVFLLIFYFLANVLERVFQQFYKPVFLRKKLWQFSLLLSLKVYTFSTNELSLVTHYGELLHPQHIYSFETLILWQVFKRWGGWRDLNTKLTENSTTIHRGNNQISCYFKQCKQIGRRKGLFQNTNIHRQETNRSSNA